MSVTHSNLGLQLREARERRGLSLAQAAADTRILQRYLIALESGNFNLLPGEVYTKGFIRNYAQYLGLPAEELIELYRIEKGGTGPIIINQMGSIRQRRSCIAPSAVMVFLVVAALAIVGYLAFNAMGFANSPLSTPTPTKPVPATPDPLPSATLNPTGIAGTRTVISGGPTGTPEPDGGAVGPTPTLEAPLVVEVRIVDSASWLRVIVDGRMQVEDIQAPGWVRRFPAQSSVEVRAGNAMSVEVTVNNGAPERLGNSPGRVVTRSFRAPTPTP